MCTTGSVCVPAERETPSAPTKSTSGKASALPTDASEGVVLTPKNVHALRTLFNIAHRLHHLLGPAWVLVLDILNTLDRILQSPRTTTQVGGFQPWFYLSILSMYCDCARGCNQTSCLICLCQSEQGCSLTMLLVSAGLRETCVAAALLQCFAPCQVNKLS